MLLLESQRKKKPWEPSHDDGAELSTQTFDINPTNVNRKKTLRDETWVKSTWNDVRKYLHQVFILYNMVTLENDTLPKIKRDGFELLFGGEVIPIV